MLGLCLRILVLALDRLGLYLFLTRSLPALRGRPSHQPGKHIVENSDIDLSPAIVIRKDDVCGLSKERKKAQG